jgi:FMN phosphatase YigB (HAD superfamily)
MDPRPELAFWLDNMAEAMTPLQGAKDLIDRLHAKNVPLFIFSNFHEPAYNQSRKLFPSVFDKFADATVSHLTQHLKPKPE